MRNRFFSSIVTLCAVVFAGCAGADLNPEFSESETQLPGEATLSPMTPNVVEDSGQMPLIQLAGFGNDGSVFRMELDRADLQQTAGVPDIRRRPLQTARILPTSLTQVDPTQIDQIPIDQEGFSGSSASTIAGNLEQDIPELNFSATSEQVSGEVGQPDNESVAASEPLSQSTSENSLDLNSSEAAPNLRSGLAGAEFRQILQEETPHDSVPRKLTSPSGALISSKDFSSESVETDVIIPKTNASESVTLTSSSPGDVPEQKDSTTADNSSVPSESDWMQGSYSHVAINEPLAQVIRDFGRAQEVATFVSKSITSTVNGAYQTSSPTEFLNRITSENGLFWYELNGQIFVFPMEELASRIVLLENTAAEEVIRSIQELGLASDQLPVKKSRDNLLRLRGPSQYIESLESLITRMDQPPAEKEADDRLILEVFRLKYALADDYSFAAGTTMSIIPGVATVLRNLIVDQDSRVAGGSLTRQEPYARPSLLGSGLIRAGEPETPDKRRVLPPLPVPSAQNASGETTALSGKPRPTSETYIQAEPRLNAVIIRDTRENLDLYREIIEAIDVPNGMVQITASIVDVDTRNDLRWAPPGRLSWTESGQTTSMTFRVTPMAPTPNVVFNLISNNEMLQFLAQVQYLEEQGQARVQSRPSVVTLSNTPAFLSSTETFFVRVAGAYQADLFNVDVGTRLQVIPRLIEEDGKRKIKLLLQINDGKVLDTDVDGVPRVRQSVISTQAVLLENESLLVGGMYRTEFIDNEQFVPKISRVPVVGKMFRSFERNSREYQRLIVITPRRVNYSDIMPNENIPYAGPVFNPEACPPGDMVGGMPTTSEAVTPETESTSLPEAIPPAPPVAQ